MACCHINQIAQEVNYGSYVISDSQLADFLAPELLLIIIDRCMSNGPSLPSEGIQTLFVNVSAGDTQNKTTKLIVDGQKKKGQPLHNDRYSHCCSRVGCLFILFA